MKYKYSFLAFSWDFNYENNDFSKYLNDFELTRNIEEAHFIFIGSFINEGQYNIVKSLNCIKILYITEPIEFTCPYSHKLYYNKECHYYIGCVENDYSKNHYSLPFFLNYPKFDNILFLDVVNDKVQNYDCDKFLNKRFCALVNRHDNGGTRVPMYNKMKHLGKIECPSALLNNCSNQEINELFNVEYYKLFQFNLCPENYLVTIPGYVTEKLWYPCLAGAIPIYSGFFGETEEKIFNKDRILFYNPKDETSMERVKEKIEFLLKNPEDFIKFYKQPVFCEFAYENLKKYKLNMYYMLRSIYEHL